MAEECQHKFRSSSDSAEHHIVFCEHCGLILWESRPGHVANPEEQATAPVESENSWANYLEVDEETAERIERQIEKLELELADKGQPGLTEEDRVRIAFIVDATETAKRKGNRS